MFTFVCSLSCSPDSTTRRSCIRNKARVSAQFFKGLPVFHSTSTLAAWFIKSLYPKEMVSRVKISFTSFWNVDMFLALPTFFQFDPNKKGAGNNLGEELTIINAVFTGLYTLEFLLKLCAFGKV